MPARTDSAKTRKLKKPEFSPTKFRTFLICQMMYRLEYIEKLGRFYHTTHASWTFGSTLHQTLQRFHVEGGTGDVSVEQLLSILNNGWRSHGYTTPDDESNHRVEAERILSSYHQSASEKQDLTRLFLSEKLLKADMGPFVITGRVDRIDEHLSDGSLEIVDYKSGRDTVTETDVQESLAMSIYQLLVRDNWPGRNVFATIHALRSNLQASSSLTDSENTELRYKLLELGNTILNKDFESVRPVPIPTVCPTCDFLRVCSRTWHKDARDQAHELVHSDESPFDNIS